MKKVITLFFCWILFCAAAFAQPELTKKEIEQLKKDQTVVKETKPFFLKEYSGTPWVAIAYFNMTPAELAGILLDFHRYTKIFPKVKDLDITPLGDSRYRLKYTVQSGLFTFRYTIIMNYNPKEGLIWWDIDPENPGDFSKYKGYWKFFKKEGMTMAVYSISPIAKLPVPEFIQQNGSRDEMKYTIEDVKNWIKTGGKEESF